MKVKMIGMNCITFCCIGSVMVVGLIFCRYHMEAPMRIGSTKKGSFTDRSVIHRANGA
ncbi:hypothetical protein D3C71_612860 [compost metagenome]